MIHSIDLRIERSSGTVLEIDETDVSATPEWRNLITMSSMRSQRLGALIVLFGETAARAYRPPASAETAFDTAIEP
jgi:hypothetical protein